MKAGTYQTDSLPRIVIVGGVLAGSAMPRNRVRNMVRSMFIDHTHQHLFQPLLYQVATGRPGTHFAK
jgi:NADH dehydrogenase FAD-containing subunit